ncbi:hypothetical protein MMC07_005206 [Pseudocyphellaria aurata]|nr:hypothetical protein [Pseudocyphellaria aurata]
MPPLHANRPTLLLASISLLQLHTHLTSAHIAALLHANFPEYAPWPGPEDVQRMHHDVAAAHPEWLAGLLSLPAHEVHEMLFLLGSEGLRRRESFPRDQRGARQARAYLENLIFLLYENWTQLSPIYSIPKITYTLHFNPISIRIAKIMEHNIPNAFQDELESEFGLNLKDGASQYCKRCDRAFETTEAYRTHLKTSKLHHVCQYCDHDCHSVRALRLHWQTSHGAVYCEYCFRHFSSPEQKRKHSDAKHCFCERCHEWFLSDGLRRSHWASSDAHKSTYCRLCKVDFNDSDACETHSCAARNLKPPREKFEKDSTSQGQDHHSKSKGGGKKAKFRDQDEKTGRSKDRSYTTKKMPPPDHLGIPNCWLGGTNREGRRKTTDPSPPRPDQTTSGIVGGSVGSRSGHRSQERWLRGRRFER